MPMWSVECWDIQELVKHHAVLGMDEELEGLYWMMLVVQDLKGHSSHVATMDCMYTTVDTMKMLVQFVSSL